MKSKEFKNMGHEEKEKKLKELKLELVKSKVNCFQGRKFKNKKH